MKFFKYFFNIDAHVIIIALKPPLNLVILHLETHMRNTVQASSKDDTPLLKSRSTFDLHTLP